MKVMLRKFAYCGWSKVWNENFGEIHVEIKFSSPGIKLLFPTSSAHFVLLSLSQETNSNKPTRASVMLKKNNLNQT